MDNHYSLTKAVDVNMGASYEKTKKPAWKLFMMAILSGFSIAIAGAGSSVAVHNITELGMCRTIMGLIFPVGLMLVIFLGAELFTGNCLMIMGVMNRRYHVLSMLRVLILVYIGNFVGSILLALLVYGCGQFDFSDGMLGAFTIKIAYNKTGISFGQAFISGILCNFLVCVAVIMANGTKDTVGKILMCFIPIFLFVVSGYEHCIANMYYISAGLLAKSNPKYVGLAEATYGITAEQINQTLNLKHFLVDNLVPVTLGNVIGGMVMVGLVLYLNTQIKKTA